MGERPAEKCCACPVVGSARVPLFFCDESPQDGAPGPWCGTCFDTTPCGQGKHGEGCETMMLGDG